jgi:hypothetical protein
MTTSNYQRVRDFCSQNLLDALGNVGAAAVSCTGGTQGAVAARLTKVCLERFAADLRDRDVPLLAS